MLSALDPIVDPSGEKISQRPFWLFITACIICVGAALLMDAPVIALLPAGVLFGLYALVNVKQLYYLFFFLLPFSIEVELPGGFGTDLPSEPIMILLTGLCIVLLIKNLSTLPKVYFVHPISILLYAHVAWIFVTAIFSMHPFISFKFFMAKIWYVVPFFFMPFLLFKDEKEYKKLFMYLGLGVFIAITFVLVKHAGKGFSFDSANKVVRPIFRNHVNYAILLLSFLPYLIYLTLRKHSYRWVKYFAIVIMLVAIYLTYTRAAQLSVVLAIMIWLMLRLQLSKYAIGIGLILAILFVGFLCTDNRYLDFAPDFEKAVQHRKFDNLVEATTKMQDISTVERFYRWIAGFYMVGNKPILGYGPSTFYTEYKKHTVTSYKTYVSDNPEKSGIHNYYLMTAVEQGMPGFLILMSLIILTILYGERCLVTLQDRQSKWLIIAATITFILINIVLLINDLLEADKVGPFFFLSMSIIVFFSCQNQVKLKKNA